MVKKMIVAAVLAVSAYNVYLVNDKENDLSGFSMKNVEALAIGEDFKEFYCMGDFPICDLDMSGRGEHLFGERINFPVE